MNWLTVVLGGLAGIGGLAGVTALLTVGATKRKLTAEADEAVAGSVRTIIGGATDSVKLLRETVAEAEQRVERVNAELRLARAQVDEYGRKVDDLTREAGRAYAELRRLRMAILDPAATLERLRAMVDPPSNGRP